MWKPKSQGSNFEASPSRPRLHSRRLWTTPTPYISLRAAQTSVNASVKVEDNEDAKRIIRLLTKYAEGDDESNDGRTSKLLNKQLQKLSTGR